MLVTAKNIALKLQGIRRISALIAILLAILFVYQLFFPIDIQHPNKYLFILGIGGLWSFLLYLFICTCESIPELNTNKLSLFARVKLRFKRGFYGLLTLCVLAMSIAVIFVTARFLRLIFVAG